MAIAVWEDMARCWAGLWTRRLRSTRRRKVRHGLRTATRHGGARWFAARGRGRSGEGGAPESAQWCWLLVASAAPNRSDSSTPVPFWVEVGLEVPPSDVMFGDFLTQCLNDAALVGAALRRYVGEIGDRNQVRGHTQINLE